MHLLEAFQQHYATQWRSAHAYGRWTGIDAVDSLRLHIESDRNSLVFFVENQEWVWRGNKEILQSLKADEYLDVSSIVAFPNDNDRER